MFQIPHSLENGVKKLLNVFLFNAGECYAEVVVPQRDETYAVFVQKMYPQKLCVHGLQIQAHEIP
jgi:hypothetical protein